MRTAGEAVPEAAQTDSPLTRLPDPLLRLIFRHLIAIWPPARTYLRYSRAGPQSRLGWVHLTHTCRRLRNVALDPESASLWGSNIVMMPRALAIFLERARDAPLSIDLAPDGWSVWVDQSQILLDLVSENTFRLERISVVLPTYSELDPWAREAATAKCAGFYAALLDTLAGKDLPLLRHLDLSYTPEVSAPSVALSNSTPFTAPNLTTLRLSRQGISADHLYDILRSSPNLASLSIEWIPTDSRSLIQLPLRDAGAPLHMPNLTDLSLSAHDFASVLAVWKLFIPCRDVRASFAAQMDDTREFQNALTALSPLFYRAGLHNLALHTTSDAFTFRMLPKRNPTHSPSLSVTTTLAPDSTTTPSELLDTFLRFIDASWLDSIHLDILSLSNPALSILSGFDTIVEMSTPFASRSILTQLSISTTSTDDPVFPSMGTLTLTPSPFEDGQKENWDIVERFLRDRREKGVEVDCVRLTGSRSTGFGSEGVNGPSRDGRKAAREVDVEGLRVIRGLVSEVVDGRK